MGGKGGAIKEHLRLLREKEKNVFKDKDLYDENDKDFWERLQKVQEEIETYEQKYQDFLEKILKSL